ncbi:MAG: DUF2203 domain-containing protein [Chloroflexota bacterium]|nr:DUF2203 domain-containing protein [Chloroflexota bacterium]
MKIWTMEEANRALPYLNEILSVLVEQNQHADLACQALLELEQRIAGNGQGKERELEYRRVRLNDARTKMQSGIEQIHRLGCQVKDLDLGLVDFPSHIDGREVLLCWQLGEPTVQYWHGTNEGFASRRLL